MLRKKFFLFLSNNETATKVARKYGGKLGANRFVAGEDLSSVLDVVKNLNQRGRMTTLDVLGEFVSSKEETEMAASNCINTLHAIHEHQLQSSLSVKLTQLGLDISEELCLENMKKILDVAKKYDLFVQIDMEDYSRNEQTLSIFKTLHKEYKDTVGTVIQAYLKKSLDDVNELHHYDATLRICKGAYKESDSVAYSDKKTIDENYIRLVKAHMLNKHYVGIATHDEKIVHHMMEFASFENISKDDFEFQMLYGIRPELEKEIVKNGYKLRIYVPFGTDWFGYFMRRLAERPENIKFVWHSLFNK